MFTENETTATPRNLTRAHDKKVYVRNPTDAGGYGRDAPGKAEAQVCR